MSLALDNPKTHGQDARVITSVGQLFEEWAASRTGVSEARQTADRTRWRNFLAPYLEKVDATRVTTDRVQQWLLAQEQSGTGPATVRATLSVLRQVLDLAVDKHLLRTNPARGEAARTDATVVAMAPRVEDDLLTDDQIQRIVESAPEVYRALFRLAAETGISWAEAMGLEVKDVDFRHGSLTIGRRIARQEGSRITYGEATARRVALSKALTQELAHHAMIVEAIKRQYGTGSEGDWLFVTVTGRRPLRSNFANTVLQPAMAMLGLDEQSFTFQNFRDTAVVNMLRSGMSLEEVSRTIGHAQVVTTRRAYGKFVPSDAPTRPYFGSAGA